MSIQNWSVTKPLDSHSLETKITLLTNTLKLDLHNHHVYLKAFLQKLIGSTELTTNSDNYVDLQANFNLTEVLQQWFGQTNLQHILLHPLVEPAIAEYFLAKGQVWIAELDKNSLHWTSDSIQNLVTDQSIRPDLAVFATPHGLAKEILENVSTLKQIHPNVQILVCLPNSKPSQELLELIQSPIINYYLWDIGPYVLQQEFADLFTSETLANYRLWLSWRKTEGIQVKTYQPQNSPNHSQKLAFVQAYLIWLLEAYKQHKPLAGWWLQTLTQWIYLNTKIPTAEAALETMQNLLTQFVQGQALDFLFFQKEPIQNSWQPKLLPENLYHLLGQQLARLPSGTTEIPSLFVNRPYRRYFFYTTEYPFWRQFLATHNLTAEPISIPPVLLTYCQQVQSLDFLSKYGLWLDLLDTEKQ